MDTESSNPVPSVITSKTTGPTLEGVGNESQTGHHGAFRPRDSKATPLLPGYGDATEERGKFEPLRLPVVQDCRDDVGAQDRSTATSRHR